MTQAVDRLLRLQQTASPHRLVLRERGVHSNRKTGVAAAAGALLLLSGCGGSGSPISTGPGGGGTTQNSPGGIWRGTESVSGLSVTGIIDESGNFQFVRSDGVQYLGTAAVNGTSLTANVEAIVPLGFTFADGSHHGSGSISGTLTARNSIQATTKFQTDLGSTAENGTLNLTFDALYNKGSSLSTLAGNFVEVGNTNVVVTVRTDGSLFSQDPGTGCVLNGTVSIINATYNAYKVQFSYGNCAGNAVVLNGVQFTGLATLDTTLAPQQLLVAATGQSGNTKYSQVVRLNRN